MKSQSVEKHFATLEKQREWLFPALRSLSKEELWQRPQQNRWSIGETMYHLYLITKMLRVAAAITIPCTKPFAIMRRNKAFAAEIHDIYQEYKQKRGKGMKAPFILNPKEKIRYSMDYQHLEGLLLAETQKIEKLVEQIDEDIAGHIIFIDPVANNPNLIQSIQLLAIHEAHHMKIMQRDFSYIFENINVK